MKTRMHVRRRTDGASRDDGSRKVINQIIEHNAIRRMSYTAYRDKVRDVYDGPQGAMLPAASVLSLHLPLGERLFRQRKFDLHGARRILDVGSGAAQIARPLIKYADRQARITCFDLSTEMLRRSRQRLKRGQPNFVAGDLSCMPFAEGSFDCVTCGYVLEYMPDARVGLAEMYRVMAPGGRLLLLTSEDSFSGAWTSRLWVCRTYSRAEIRESATSVGFTWQRELWFSRLHKLFRAGGICVELVKPRE